MSWTKSEIERYERCVQATLAAVRDWKRAHLDLRPTIGWPARVVLIMTLEEALQDDGKPGLWMTPAGGDPRVLDLQMNDAARELARHIAATVPEVSWKIFRSAWEQTYSTRVE